ncbi:hypothetical protein EGW08_022612 [Elysia chlorotica]|uniref:Transposase n=1 Tax=Elysia chlorotica TaxID=188477 RepID=A0A433SKH8_ELYCH|nr:hypothetical protein EGW08_022612 [Elysia chlorotica]
MAEKLRKTLWIPGNEPDSDCTVSITGKLNELVNSIDPAPEALGIYKVKFKLTRHQHNVLKDLLAASNLAWNWTKWLIEDKGIKRKDEKTLQSIVAKKSIEDPLMAPREVHDNAKLLHKTSTIRLTGMKSYLSALKSSMTLHKGRMEKFDVDYKELYPASGTFTVQKLFIKKFDISMVNKGVRSKVPEAFYRLSITPDSFGNRNEFTERFLRISKKRSYDRMPPINHDSQIQLRKDGHWLLLIPCDRSYLRCKQPESIEKSVVGVDPGGRTFQTTYDPIKREVKEFHSNKGAEFRYIELMKVKAKRHEEHAKNVKSFPKYKEHKAAARKYWHKYETKRNDLHRKLSSKMVRENKLIVIGDLSTKNACKKGGKLHKKSKDDLYTWAHYEFRQRLIDRARGTNTKVIVQDESYTSMTCGNCGHRKTDLGGDKVYNCTECGCSIGRDVNGGRNILIKAMIE